MKLVHVIPIAKGVTYDQLSYFTAGKIVSGALISVPLRSKMVPAIVVGVEDLRSVRSQVRGAKYKIKKIVSLRNKRILSETFLQAVGKMANYNASSMGAVFYTLIPKVFLDSLEIVPELKKVERCGAAQKPYIIEAPYAERVRIYYRQIEKSLLRCRSVYILVPTIQEAERIEKELAFPKENVFIFHSGIAKKKLRLRMSTLLRKRGPVVIIGTGSFLALPRLDIGSIIMERESSGAYKQLPRPFVDIRTFAWFLSQFMGARLILGDSQLRTETMWKIREKQYARLGGKDRSRVPKKQSVIDMREYRGKTFRVLSPELEKLLTESGEHVFLFNARRGVAPSTICEDCGEITVCDVCEAPVVLHREMPQNVFVCHNCGSRRSAKERCRVCRSWKLKPMGIGVDRVVEELHKLVPERDIFSINSDTTKTHGAVKKEMKAFFDSKSGVLVGTQMSLPYIEERISTVAIVSMDSLLSLPDPKAYEKAYILLLTLKELTEKVLLLQTRQPELALIKHTFTNTGKSFYMEELVERKRFDYPPFTVLIKISIEGTRKNVAREMESIKKLMSDFKFQIYLAFSRTKRGHLLHALLRVKYNEWPNTKLINILRSLPPSVTINVEPESVL